MRVCVSRVSKSGGKEKAWRKVTRDTQASWDREIRFTCCFVKRKYALLSPANNPSFRVVVASVPTFRRVRIVHEYLKVKK